MSLYIVNLINHFSVDLALEYFSMIRRVGRDAPLYMSHNMSHKASLMSLYIVNLINHFPAGLALKYFSMISAGLALEYALWELVPSWYGVATMSRRLKMIGLFRRISSLL